ncbi:acyltransferase [Acinetobacter sp. MD2(2019)]|uniref:acyltransferase family protein n=1 Tax=Acinetobacter sp. MD2(2019) TaxID=2605273 RepID=UPI002D1F46E3|nr:acyltransferase [Acinetobacter sp. MD2(2019)]MEB3753388.1 acyltransferase [Acinetobacter sp. MD2(2019)]
MAKLNAAESIRGLACLAVVFSHLSLSFYPYLHHFSTDDRAHGQWDYFIHHSPFAFWYSGTAAVFVFFVLSGFVLSYAILKNSNIPKKVAEMSLKRYPRLAIPAFLSCILAWAAISFTHINSDLVNGWFQSYATGTITLAQAAYEGSIGAFLFAQSGSNWVLWTMQIELFGSILLFVLLLLYHYQKALFFLGSILLPLLGFFINERFFLGLFSFVIGSYMYLYGRKIPAIVGWPMFLLGLYFAGAHNSSHAYRWIYEVMGWRTYDYCNFFSGILIVYSILLCEKLSDLFDRPAFIYLGKLSFSIYLLHMMMIYLVCLPVFNILMVLHLNYDLSVLLSVMTCLISILLVSALYSRYVDDFAVRVSQRFAKLFIH